MPGQLHDWIAETPESIAARLQGAQEAQRQTRFTLGMMTLISMMMLILSYNAYLSFDSRWITQLAEAHRIIESLETKVPVEDLLIHQALQDWASARNATIELLGIRVSVDDAPILGTTSLFVFALWLVLVTRRENHTIGSLLRDTDTPRPDGDSGVVDRTPSAADLPDLYSNGQRWLIFHTIAASNLFVTFDRSMSRIESLRGKNVLMSKPEGVKGLPGRLGLAFARDFFFLFPVAASLFVFYLDRLSYLSIRSICCRGQTSGSRRPALFRVNGRVPRVLDSPARILHCCSSVFERDRRRPARLRPATAVRSLTKRPAANCKWAPDSGPALRRGVPEGLRQVTGRGKVPQP